MKIFDFFFFFIFQVENKVKIFKVIFTIFSNKKKNLWKKMFIVVFKI